MLRISRKNFLSGLFFFTIGLIMLYASYSPESYYESADDELGVMDYPRAILYAWLPLSFISMFVPNRDDNDFIDVQAAIPSIIKIFLTICFYTILLSYIGVICSTFIFVFLFLYFMQSKNLKTNFIFSAIAAFLTWFVFQKLLNVIFPTPFWL